MASDKQIAANRANAKRSTGPRSQEGKRRSSMNSCKHAVLAKSIVIDDEDPPEFEDLLKSLIQEFNPNSGSESELVLRLPTNFWRLRRIPRFEARFLHAEGSEVVYRDPRVDKLIDDDVKRIRKLDELAAEHFGTPSGLSADEIEKQTRASFNELRPPEVGQVPPSPIETQEMLAKISRYETALLNSISRMLNLLMGLQNVRTQTDARSLKLVNRS